MIWIETPGFFASSLSNAISPALRTGFLVAPEGQSDEMTRIMAATTLHAPLLMTELAPRWMESGEIASFEATVREETRTRQALARKHLKGLEFRTHPHGFLIWLTLTEPWRPTDFPQATECQGLILTPTDSFAIGRNMAPFAERLSITGPMAHEDLTTGLGFAANMAREASPSISVMV